MKIRSLLGVIGLALVFEAPLAVAQQVPHPVSGPSTSTIGDYACWGNALGQGLVDCGTVSNPISGPSTTTIGDIATWASTNGKSLADSVLGALTMLPGGTTVVQTLTSMFGLHPYLTWWGAKNDGSTDVAAALNAAVSAAQGSPANPVVYVPAGEYLLNGTGGTINLSHVKIVCQGAGADADASPSGTGSSSLGYQGATFWLTSTSVHPFAFGPGVTFEGCNFYWPNQRPNGGTAITVGSSPFSYTNSTAEAMEVSVTGGTVASVVVNGVTQGNPAYTSGNFNVPSGQTITVTYTAAPIMDYWEPTVYPSLFTEISGSQATNVSLINDHIINAYDVWDQASASDSQGSIVLDGTYGYAIHDWFYWALNMNTTVIHGLLADASLSQQIDPTPYFMREWTAHNGAVWDVWGTTGAGGSQTNGGIGAIEMSDGGVYGYRFFIHINSGGLISESNFTGNTIDGVGTAVQVDAGGCLAGTRLTGDWYAYISDGANGLWNPKATDDNPMFSLNSNSGQGCVTNEVEIDGIMEQAQGDVLDISGPNVKEVTLSLPGSDTYGRTAASGTFFFVQSAIDATSLILDVHDTHVEPVAADVGINRQGFYLNALYQATIDDNTFNGVYNAITLGAAVNVGHVSGAGNIAVSSPTGAVDVGAGSGPTYDYQDVHTMLSSPSNIWDKANLPTCSTNCASVTIGSGASYNMTVSSGTITSAALTFGLPYNVAPACYANDNTQPVYASPSTSGVTVASYGGANIGGSTVTIVCRP